MWRLGPALALAVMFALATFGVMSYHANLFADRANHQSAQHVTAATSEAVSSNDKIVDYTKTVANWTMVLGVATALLWITAVGVAIVQHRDTIKAIDLSRREFIAAHRPRLIVRHVKEIVPGSHKPFSAQIHIANVGGAAATIVENKVVLKFAVAPSRKDRQDLKDSTTFIYSEKIVPGQLAGPITISSGSATWTFEPPNTPVIYGYIVYEDDTGIRRRTVFYRYLAGDVWEHLDPKGRHPDQEYAD